MKRNDIVRIRIEGLTPKGRGSATVEGRTVEVKGALPGDVVDVCVMAVRRHTARVKLEEIVGWEVERIPAECIHFGVCGGCSWQNVPYTVQCRLKTGMVRIALESAHGVESLDNIEFIPSPEKFYYRNKMEFSFDRIPREGEIVRLGLHEAGRYDRIFDMEGCRLQSELSNRIVGTTRDFCRTHNLSAYGLKSHVGLLRFLTIRDGKNTGDLMVNLVTSGDDFPLAGMYSEYLSSEIPEITTIIRSINRSKGSVAVGEEREVLEGSGFITDSIGGLAFTISPDSFFQTNTLQAENLYDTIKSFCGLDGSQHLLDLYCGTGTIGLYCAKDALSVTGIEAVDDAVSDALRNAELNGISNCSFIAGKVEKLPDDSMDTFDVVICDPPRAGIHPKAMNLLVRNRIPRMVYVSCNVRALPEDLEMLILAGYKIKQVSVFDMSPHTPHVETVILLEL